MTTNQPAIEPVTERDIDEVLNARAAGYDIRYALEQDRRRVAERVAARKATLPRDTSAEQIEYLRAEVERLTFEMHDCEPFLKEGERLDECIERWRADAAAVFDLLVQEKKKSEALEAEVARLTAALNEKEKGNG